MIFTRRIFAIVLPAWRSASASPSCPTRPFGRFLELLQLAEQNGFEYGWTYDSHVLWQESIPLLALAADRTSTMKLGHFVTNPGTREPTVLASAYATLHDISGGRMVMGIGRGDSARRFIGQQPVKMAEFEEACRMIRDFMNGREVHWNDKDLQLTWAHDDPPIPMFVAGYGPEGARRCRARLRRRDHPARRPGDHRVDHGHRPRVGREGRPRPGRARSASSARPRRSPPTSTRCREEVRWFPAMVSNHVMDLVERYGYDSDIPSELTDFVKARKFYDYKDHSRVGAAHGEFVTDEICDRFMRDRLGRAVRRRSCARSRRSGVDQFNVYLMTNAQEETLEAYGRDVIPQFADTPRSNRLRLSGKRSRARWCGYPYSPAMSGRVVSNPWSTRGRLSAQRT